MNSRSSSKRSVFYNVQDYLLFANGCPREFLKKKTSFATYVSTSSDRVDFKRRDIYNAFATAYPGGYAINRYHGIELTDVDIEGGDIYDEITLRYNTPGFSMDHCDQIKINGREIPAIFCDLDCYPITDRYVTARLCDTNNKVLFTAKGDPGSTITLHFRAFTLRDPIFDGTSFSVPVVCTKPTAYLSPLDNVDKKNSSWHFSHEGLVTPDGRNPTHDGIVDYVEYHDGLLPPVASY